MRGRGRGDRRLYWKLILTVSGGSDSSKPGQTYTETDWLARDGTLLQSTGVGAVPASRIDLGPTMQHSMAVAAAAAISWQTGTGDDFYQCFPPTPGASATGVITTDPFGATKYSTVPVTCTTNVAPRPDGLAWRMTLDAHWDAGDGRTAGDIVATIDVDAAGAPGTPVVSGDPLPKGPTPITGAPAPQESPASP